MYVEDLLALNFMMNASLLYLTARLTGRKVVKKRIFAGGFIAAIYSLAVFLPSSVIIFSWVGKIVASILVIVLTFQPKRIVETLRLCAAFFLASFFLGGTIFALYFFGNASMQVSGGVFYIEPPQPGMLFMGVLIAFSLLTGVWHFAERQRKRKEYRYQLTIYDLERSVCVQALVDTGNQLRDPISGRPLCVASFMAFRELLPDCLFRAYDTGSDPVAALAEIESTDSLKFGVVPFRSLEHGGMLVTYRPSLVIVEGIDHREEKHDLFFALTTKALSLDNDVEVLLHPSILETTGGGSC